MGADAFQLPKEGRQGRALIAATEQGGERMLVGIELGEPVEAKEGGKKQGLKASPQRLVTVMHEGKVVIGVRLLMGCDRLVKPSHNRVKGACLIEPMRKEMHAHRGQTGLYADDVGAGGCMLMTGGVARASLGSTQMPLTSQAVEMADTDVKRRMTVGDLVEQEPTGALGLFMKYVEDQRLFDVTALSTRIKGWT